MGTPAVVITDGVRDVFDGAPDVDFKGIDNETDAGVGLMTDVLGCCTGSSIDGTSDEDGDTDGSRLLNLGAGLGNTGLGSSGLTCGDCGGAADSEDDSTWFAEMQFLFLICGFTLSTQLPACFPPLAALYTSVFLNTSCSR